jgi:hypothetical protein
VGDHLKIPIALALALQVTMAAARPSPLRGFSLCALDDASLKAATNGQRTPDGMRLVRIENKQHSRRAGVAAQAEGAF